MSKGSIITLVVLIIAIVGGLLIYKDRRTAAAHVEARSAAMEIVEPRPFFIANREYVEGLLDRFHDEAFEKAYVHGGLMAASEFDVQTYLENLWDLVNAQATADGRQEVADGFPAMHR